MTEPPPPPRRRLDPSRAAAQARRAGRGEPPSAPEPGASSAFDPRRFRWALGIFGLLLVAAISVHELTVARRGSAGVPAGQTLPRFVAPLASGRLRGEANVRPRCDPAHPNPQALNVCDRTPLVLALFVTRSGTCVDAVDALQAVSKRLAGRGIAFAAVAVSGSRRTVARLARRRGWTIPVAVDPDGAVGQLLGAVICPLDEVVGAGGRVEGRLIGTRWSDSAALAGRVRRLLSLASGSGG